MLASLGFLFSGGVTNRNAAPTQRLEHTEVQGPSFVQVDVISKGVMLARLNRTNLVKGQRIEHGSYPLICVQISQLFSVVNGIG